MGEITITIRQLLLDPVGGHKLIFAFKVTDLAARRGINELEKLSQP